MSPIKRLSWEFECPTCGAPRFHDCRTLRPYIDSRTTSTHLARRRLAAEANAPARPVSSVDDTDKERDA